jgi:hypothetical protein
MNRRDWLNPPKKSKVHTELRANDDDSFPVFPFQLMISLCETPNPLVYVSFKLF